MFDGRYSTKLCKKSKVKKTKKGNISSTTTPKLTYSTAYIRVIRLVYPISYASTYHPSRWQVRERKFAFHIKIVAYFRKQHKFFVEIQEVAFYKNHYTIIVNSKNK